jgi:hypothetical protein
MTDDFWSGPSWREAARDYHKARGDQVSIAPFTKAELARVRRLPGSDVSLARAWYELSRTCGRAAGSTVDALVFALRRGLDAIKHPDNHRRLGELSDAQMGEVAGRVQKFMPHVASAWESADVAALISLWSRLR